MMGRKFYTSINVLCLTIGIVFAMLIGMFITGELEVNKSLESVEQLYLVQNKIKGNTTGIGFFTPALLSKKITEEHPDRFSGYYRFWDRSITVSKEDKHHRLQSMIGDASFLRVFGFPVLHGDKTNPLSQPNSMVVTEEVAKRFFNRTDVVNETLSVSTEQKGIKEYRITAVIAEPDDKNTVTDLMNMNAQIFLSLENVTDFFTASDPDSWHDEMICYVRLVPAIDKSEAEELFNRVLQSRAPQTVAENRTIELAPLTDYYLITNHGAVMKLIISLCVIALFILLLALTNYINISMASSFSRLKEVGIRKVIGGARQQLVAQFLTEAVVLTVIAGLFSLGLYQVLYPFANELLCVHLPSVPEFKPLYFLIMAGAVLLIGVMAGAYPALFQSAAKPIESLKGKARSVQGTMSFSRILITVQFAITTFIFIGAIVLSMQTTFFLERDLGYNQSHVLVVSSVPRTWNEEGFQKIETAAVEFLKSSKVKSVSLSWGMPGWGIGGSENSVFKAGSPEAGIKAHITGVDEHFDEVYELSVLEGVFLGDERMPWHAGNLVLNESARLALDVNVGDKLQIDESEFTVCGVVGDFNYESMHQVVKPAIFIHNRDYNSFRLFSFRLEPASTSASVAEVERLWKEVFPDEPFTYYFADQGLQALYTTELQLKKASTIATVLMMIIVVTGVLGLVSLNVFRRNKEIGIRKVLGASVLNILTTFSKEYARLILVSFLLGIPLAYYFAEKWLENFAYHIDLDWWMFTLPAVILMSLVVFIVSILIYQRAVMNPVKSLRHE